MRYPRVVLSFRDRLIKAVRQGATLLLLLAFAAVVQIAWNRELTERSEWTIYAGVALLWMLILSEVCVRAPTGYLEITDGVMTQRYNEVEHIVRLDDVVKATVVNLFGIKSIVLQMQSTKFHCEYEQYSAQAIEPFQLALGNRLKRGGILDHFKTSLGF
jgi:hypothetical protein